MSATKIEMCEPDVARKALRLHEHTKGSREPVYGDKRPTHRALGSRATLRWQRRDGADGRH